MQIVTDPKELQPGKWYALGFGNESATDIDWNNAMIYRYDGDGCWSNDDGEPVESTLDPFLQMRVGMDSAEAYGLQA
jgi:hypothetical protein